jgi:hypothetical protein
MICSIWSRNHGSIRQARGRLDRHAAAQQLADLEDPSAWRWRSRQQRRRSIGELASAGIAAETERPCSSDAALLQALGERAPDRHHLADALHLRAEDPDVPGSFSNAHRGIFVTT